MYWMVFDGYYHVQQEFADHTTLGLVQVIDRRCPFLHKELKYVFVHLLYMVHTCLAAYTIIVLY